MELARTRLHSRHARPSPQNLLQRHCYMLKFANINRVIFLPQFEFGYPLPLEHVQFLMERILHGLMHSPFPSVDVMITLGICDDHTLVKQVFFRIFLDYVLPEEIQDYCSISIVYHQCDTIIGWRALY